MALSEYVKNVVARIIEQKKSNGISPAVCTHKEIMLELREDVTECMRQLHHAGEYEGSININRVPMLKEKCSTQNK